MAADPVSRRAFLRYLLGAGAATAVGGAVLIPKHSAASPLEAESTPSARYALIIDTNKCVGCGACVEACRLVNALPGDKSYIHIISEGEGSSRKFLPVQCQHCADAPCARVCPTKATYRRDDGVVLINEKICVGCKYCEVACPYQARTYDEKRGVVDKCWLCLSRVLNGEDPACVQACILGARIFGRQDDPNSEVAQLIASGKATVLHPEFGTNPGVLHYIL